MANELYLYQWGDAATGGHKIGATSSDKLGFFGTAPIARPSSTSQAAYTGLVTSVAATLSTAVGALQTRVNQVIASLLALGIIDDA